jgi:hypothetical protein
VARIGVVTSSQIERNSPITANVEVWDFNDRACCSIAEIRLIALNVTTPELGLAAKDIGRIACNNPPSLHVRGWSARRYAMARLRIASVQI